MRALRDWQDALVIDLVDRIFNGADPVQECRRFEGEYFRLSGSDLLAVREAELERERDEYVLEVLKATDPAKVTG